MENRPAIGNYAASSFISRLQRSVVTRTLPGPLAQVNYISRLWRWDLELDRDSTALGLNTRLSQSVQDFGVAFPARRPDL
jgi:hypothetical protein